MVKRHIVPAIGSLGSKPAVPVMPVGFLCWETSLFSFDFLQIEPLYCHSRRDRAVSLRFVWINAFGDLRCEFAVTVTGFFLSCSLQKVRCTPGERGPAVALDERRKILGYQRRCSLMKVTHLWWHQWLVVMATLCWQWNVIFHLFPLC